MDLKKARHFLCGLLCGAVGMHWYVVSSQDTFAAALAWLQNLADEYRATHDTPTADAGWRPKPKENR